MGRMDIEGHCDDRFAEVREEFERNFAERGELGASVAVTVDGETVVDLWGGYTDGDRTTAWAKDTLCVAMSCTKGPVALCAHLLAIAGDLDFDAPVAQYWPEFAANGKEHVLVRHVLSHQAGLPALRDFVPAGGFYDWDDVVARLAAESPFWEPGTRHGYHALTWGFLVGEIIRRITGIGVGEFLAQEVAGPLGLDLWVGLPESEHPRVARLLGPPTPGDDDVIPKFVMQSLTEPGSIPMLVMLNNGGYLAPGSWDSPEALAAVIPASGGVTNARALAGLYRAVVHDRRVGRFTIAPEDLAQMAAVQSAATEDAVLSAPGRWTLGFMKGGWSPRDAQPPTMFSVSEDVFGHTGNGGSVAFGDPVARLSFGYVMNQMSAAMGLGPTGQSLVDAVYRALGYRREKYAIWVR